MSVGRRRVLLAGGLAAALLAAAPARAIDNPDAPDFVAGFEARAKPLEDRIAGAGDGRAVAEAQRAFAKFLDDELNAAYRTLLSRLDAGPRGALIVAQRQWLAFRRAEVEFIGRHWTAQNFGSSSAMSRADHANAIARQRVVTLLTYLKGLPAERK